MNMKLKRAAFKHIEAEIYAYQDTVNAIEELRRDIILAGRTEDSLGLAAGGDFSTSLVERRATKLADHIMLREMERVTRAIAATYMVAKEESRKIIWLKYGLAISWEPSTELVALLGNKNRFDMNVSDMAGLVPVAESTFHQYRTGFVYGIAEKLGWW